jgi:PPIC-type PPIASE domain
MTTSGRLAASLAALACTVAGLGACGGTNPHRIVVRVGRVSISQATLSRWISVLAGAHMGRGARRHLKRQALGFLIATDWLIGEAADQGTPISRREIDERPEMARKLAATKIRQRLEATVPRVTATEIDQYYKQNVKEFALQEQRRFYIEEDLTSRAAAVRRRREFELGKASIAKTGATLDETVGRPADMRGASAIVKAMFVARPGAVVGPIHEQDVYFVMKLTLISPPRVRSLADAKDTIRSGLENTHWQQTLDRFARTLRSKWTAKTDCTAGYVVQQCKQYKGRVVPESPLASG